VVNMYAVIFLGNTDCSYVVHDLDEVMRLAQGHVDQTIVDHYTHETSLKVTPEVAAFFEVQVYELGVEGEVELPLQEWVDEHYQTRLDAAQEWEEERYERYLKDHKHFSKCKLYTFEGDAFECAVVRTPHGEVRIENGKFQSPPPEEAPQSLQFYLDLIEDTERKTKAVGDWLSLKDA